MGSGMYLCVELDQGACLQWQEVGLTLLTLEQLGALTAAVFLVLGVAFGFRILRQMLWR